LRRMTVSGGPGRELPVPLGSAVPSHHHATVAGRPLGSLLRSHRLIIAPGRRAGHGVSCPFAGHVRDASGRSLTGDPFRKETTI
jgi:hypothetical protein